MLSHLNRQVFDTEAQTCDGEENWTELGEERSGTSRSLENYNKPPLQAGVWPRATNVFSSQLQVPEKLYLASSSQERKRNSATDFGTWSCFRVYTVASGCPKEIKTLQEWLNVADGLHCHRSIHTHTPFHTHSTPRPSCSTHSAQTNIHTKPCQDLPVRVDALNGK